MRESYQLKDIIHDLIGRYHAAGATHIDDPTLESLKIALPQLFEVISSIFSEMPFEIERVEWSMLEIGKEKQKWAKQFKELFDDLCYTEEDENEED